MYKKDKWIEKTRQKIKAGIDGADGKQAARATRADTPKRRND